MAPRRPSVPVQQALRELLDWTAPKSPHALVIDLTDREAEFVAGLADELEITGRVFPSDRQAEWIVDLHRKVAAQIAAADGRRLDGCQHAAMAAPAAIDRVATRFGWLPSAERNEWWRRAVQALREEGRRGAQMTDAVIRREAMRLWLISTRSC